MVSKLPISKKKVTNVIKKTMYSLYSNLCDTLSVLFSPKNDTFLYLLTVPTFKLLILPLVRLFTAIQISMVVVSSVQMSLPLRKANKSKRCPHLTSSRKKTSL